MKPDNFYTTYNARHLAPKEVAETFIWSDNFGKLIQNNHAIILGARGCGKTTLMKMLTIPALYNWDSEKAENIRTNIPFYSIYISTDIYWNVKNQTYGSQLKEYGELSNQISRFAVNSNVFSSLCDTFINIIESELKDNDENKEIELCKELIKAWKLSNTIPKLKFVKEALYERVDEVNQLIQEIIFNYDSSKDIPNPEYFNLAFDTSLELVIPKFERIFGIDGNENKRKWALCFDELEFAPEWLREKLFSSLRSRTQYLLYKLSSSPILPSELKDTLHAEYGPTSGNDVELIKMWTSNDNEEFSQKIIQSLIKDKGSIDEYFGSNKIYNKSADSYVDGSKFNLAVKELIKKDDSFKDFLETKEVDLENPVPRDAGEKDTLYRKIKPIVYFRNAFIDSNRKGGKITYRSRKKAPDLYHGVEVLSKVCDGNPRWLIGIVSQILINAKSDKKVSRIDQYSELYRASTRFKNVMENIPVGNCDLTIVNILDRIGEYFRDQVLGETFFMDPKGTFEVDENEVILNDNIVELIEKGVAQGAIILLEAKESSFDFMVREQRFRLSYLFSILYDLPLRTYKECKLSECLSDKKSQPLQGSLFN